MNEGLRRQPSGPLYQARLSALLTRKQLAGKSGVCMRTLYSIETLGKPCRMDIKRRILKGLGIPFARRTEVFPELAEMEMEDRADVEVESESGAKAEG